MSAFMIALIGGIFSILGNISGVVMTNLLNKRNTSIYKDKVIKSARQIGLILAQLRRETGGIRALLIRAENGKIRNLDTTKFITVVDESYDFPASSSIDRFQKYRADKSYMALIKNILENPIFHLKVNEMEDGFLKNYYLSQGINNSLVFSVQENEKQLWFVSLSFLGEIDLNDPKIRVAIDSTHHILENLISECPEAVA